MKSGWLFTWLAGFGLNALAAAAPVVFENPSFRYAIAPDGRVTEFTDRATGSNYLSGGTAVPCGFVKVGDREQAATSAELAGPKLTLGFGDTGIRAQLRVETKPHAVLLTVEALSGGTPDTLTFLNVPLSLRGNPSESFGAGALALNLTTRVDALPALQSHLRASCSRRFGLTNARVAIVAGPMDRLLPAFQATLATDSELPACRVAGPWAREVPFNHGSYLFNFGQLTETNVTDWIGMTRSLGFNQIDHHGGSSFFRFGDFELNRTKWPEGWNGYRKIVTRLHQDGIDSIFHTYAFFLDKQSRYVTPVPDARLDAFRTFTLAAPLTADAKELTVNESTAGISTVMGPFEYNSLTLHIENELVTFTNATRTAPWRFMGLKRGAQGTTTAAHAAGAKARHLKECLGLFVPDPESTLFTEIAANHATVVNQCEFDGLYLDAIDCSALLRGPDEAWYWASRFVTEIQKRLKKPVGMEMSAQWHHFWQYRTRWQAWDYPQRGHLRFIDLHAQQVNGGLLLPLHLGWWGFQTFNPPQIEPTYPDVMEQLGARLVGWDAGVSLTAGVSRDALRRTPLFSRAADILHLCEDLRHEGAFDAAARAKLRDPQSQFALVTNQAGKIRFQRQQSHPRIVALGEPWTLAWPITNAFAAQPVRMRIEALMSTLPPTATNGVPPIDLLATGLTTWKARSADGVSARLGTNGTWSATNAGRVPRNAAWVCLERTFEPWLNLTGHQALVVDVEGDGSGALLAIRLESPRAKTFGAVADRYVPLDFTGHRTLVLVESESTRWSDYEWGDGKSLYNVYRETIDFSSIESVSVWLQNLPPGRETTCRIGSIRAVPLKPAGVANPKVQVGSAKLEFPVQLAPGSWIEANRPDDCRVYTDQGELLGTIKPRGEWPQVEPEWFGSNLLATH